LFVCNNKYQLNHEENSVEDPNRYRHPRRINEPLLVFAWPAPQVLPALYLMGVTMLLGNFLMFLGAAVFWWFLYGYTSNKLAPGMIFHYLWWHGWTTGLTKECSVIPDGLKREFHQ
jgi:hypothetical protein